MKPILFFCRYKSCKKIIIVSELTQKKKMLGQLFVGLSAGLIFTLVTTVLVELIPQRSASLVALNSLARNIFAAAGTAIAEPLLSALGNGWTFLVAAGLTVVSAFVMIMMKRNGERWREALTLT